MSNVFHDEISVTSFARDFDRYSLNSLRSDLFAGFVVALLTVPQSLAFSIVAGLPLIAGIYASVFAAMIVAFFGSSRHLIVGPSNAIAILIQTSFADILFTYYRDVTGPEREVLVFQILTQLLLLVGMIQILAAFLRLGRLTHFVSHTVIIAYLGGVALALIINQLFPLLGLAIPSDLSSLFERGGYILTHLHLAHWPTAFIGLSCLFSLIFLRRLDPKIPGGAVILGSVAVVAYFSNFIFNYLVANDFQFYDWNKIEEFIAPIQSIGETGVSLWSLNWDWPFFNPGLMNHLLPVAFAIALLSVIEATSAAKSIAASSGQHLSTNQEILGLGIGNFFSAFIGAMPVSGSASRSAISYANGGKTRLAAIFNSIFTAIFLFVFGFLIAHIPVAAFSALLIVSAGSIVNLKQLFVCLKATRSDSWVLILTFISCLFFSLDMAFYIGVVLSITLYLKKAAIPQLAEFTVDETGILRSIEGKEGNAPRKIRLIKVEGELFFGAADIFQSTLKSITEDDTTTRVIILQLKNARDIDATACLALHQLHDYLKVSGRFLIACGIPQHIWDVLSDSGIVELIGKSNLFIFDRRHPHLSVQKAFIRANDLINASNPPLVISEASISASQEIPCESY